MLAKDQIIEWIKDSDLSDGQSKAIADFLDAADKNDNLQKFQIKRLKENLKINTRFLDKAVQDLEKTVILLKASNSQLSNFVKVSSHDLKSPLRSISSFSGLLLKMLDGKLNDKEESYFQIIEKSAKSMSQLIDDLLIYTKLNAEHLNVDNYGLEILLSDVLQNLNFDISSNNVIVENNMEHINLDCDAIKFKQLLQNLISNAIKFSTYGDNQAHIILESFNHPQEWQFTISDNGIGIDKSFRNDVFGEFTKLNGNDFEGTGIGLSICKKIVDKHRGRIWIEPKDEVGTKIAFTIAKNL